MSGTHLLAGTVPQRLGFRRSSLRLLIGLGLVFLYAASLHSVDFSLDRLARGVPLMIAWSAKAWPPDLHDVSGLMGRAWETVAMALIGTTIASLFAVPLCLVASRNINPSIWSQQTVRGILNALRGTDAMIFAFLFVVAVGLGPFAGVLGVAVHSSGVIAKLWSEAIEAVDPGPLQAATLTGASRMGVVAFALIPDVLPSLASTWLYAIDFNVRASTVLGLVGAGGIGQELKNNVDLLNFPRIFTILLVILFVVTVVDQLSSLIRRRLL